MTDTIEVRWDPNMVLLSYGISFIGSYVAVSLCEEYRLCRTNPYKDFKNMVNPNIILILVAISIGGVAVWSMHFIGMSAIKLKSLSGYEIRMGYDIGLTVASIFVVIICAYLGLLIASNDRAFTKTKEQILNMVVDDARRSGVRVSSKFAIVALASLNKPYFLAAGGIVTAAGVCAMHYLGMASQRFDGYMEWEPGVIAASVAIAVVVSIVAFWILFRLLALYPYMEWLRVASAMVMGLAVNAMHYTGMYGATFHYDPGRASRHNKSSIVSESLALSLALVMGSVVAWALIIVAIRDMRSWHRYCANVIAKTDEIFAKAAGARAMPVGPFFDKYKEARGKAFDSAVAAIASKSADVAISVDGPGQVQRGRGFLPEMRSVQEMRSLQESKVGNGLDQGYHLEEIKKPQKRIGKKDLDKIPSRAPQKIVVVPTSFPDPISGLVRHFESGGSTDDG